MTKITANYDKDVLVEALEQAGISTNGISVYIALLHSGALTMAEVARRAGLKRTTAYDGMRELLSSGFVSQSIKGRTKIYMPENPNKIYTEIARRQKKLQDALPQLESMYTRATHTPTIEYYEGKDGMKKVFLAIAETYSPIYGFFSPGKFYAAWGDMSVNSLFLNKLSDHEVVLKDLVPPDTVGMREYKMRKKAKNNLVQARLLPKDFDISVNILITGDKVAMISLDHLVAVLIENKEIANFQRSVHTFIWKHSK